MFYLPGYMFNMSKHRHFWVKQKKYGLKQTLFICVGFMSQSRIFHFYKDVTITGEGPHILTYTRHSLPSGSGAFTTCFYYCYLSLVKGMVLYLNSFESPSPNDVLCKVDWNGTHGKNAKSLWQWWTTHILIQHLPQVTRCTCLLGIEK